MTQSEFVTWLENVLSDAPMEELIDPEILEHMDRVQLEGEERAWNFAKEDAREPFQIAIRAMCKTLFAVGYDAGRGQAQVDTWFGEGSGLADEDSSSTSDSDDDRSSPRGLLPS